MQGVYVLRVKCNNKDECDLRGVFTCFEDARHSFDTHLSETEKPHACIVTMVRNKYYSKQDKVLYCNNNSNSYGIWKRIIKN
jgi:hypothetical protein